MVDWQVTATTIYCEDVDDEVTIIVNGDGTVKCSGVQKYTKPTRETAEDIKKKSKQKGVIILCKETSCSKLPKYRDELMKKK